MGTRSLLKLAFLFSVSMLLIAPLARAQDTSKVDALKAQIIAEENAGKLAIGHFARCTEIGGYGQCADAGTNKVAPGSSLKFYFEPINLHTKQDGNVYQRWFKEDMIVRDGTGKELLRQVGALNFNYTTKRPVFDIFVTNNLDLGDLEAGAYEFEVVLHDQLKQQSVNYVYKFEIGS